MASLTLAGLSAALPADRHLPLIGPLNATTHPLRPCRNTAAERGNSQPHEGTAGEKRRMEEEEEEDHFNNCLFPGKILDFSIKRCVC